MGQKVGSRDMSLMIPEFWCDEQDNQNHVFFMYNFWKSLRGEHSTVGLDFWRLLCSEYVEEKKS